MKFVTMESTISPGNSLSYASCTADQKAVFDEFLTASTGVYLGRDTSYPFVALKMHPGEDEYTFKKRYRD